MVDLLAKQSQGGARTGFHREFFADFEAEKGLRAQSLGVALEISEPVWKADDPRWLMNPPYGFVPYTLRFGGLCVYCGYHIKVGTFALYSRRIQSVAHRECHADYDREVPDMSSQLSEQSRGAERCLG